MATTPKDVLIMAAQACINTYRGKHGAENYDIYKTHSSFDTGDVEWDMAWYDHQTVVIVFRGSKGSEDWKANFRFRQMKVPYENMNPKIRVHTGFIDQYLEARPIIHRELTEGRYKDPKNVVVTGHSLGGALATLCAVDLKYHNQELPVVCIPLASPRVGNRAFAQSYDMRVPVTHRIINGHDTVCKVPPMWLGYEHVGTSIYVGKKAWWWYIIHPFLALFGNPMDHKPQEYLKGVRNMVL